MTNDNTVVSRRALLKATGAMMAASVGAVGNVTALPCVAAKPNTQGYDSCPNPTPTMWAAEGRPGLVTDTCWDDGVEYKKVSYCTESLWIKSEDLVSATDCTC